MRKYIAIVTGALAIAVASPAQALNTRTWVSGTGSDAVGCGAFATPCRTLQFAHNNTVAGGEIDVKDSAGYGFVVITKAINIVANGVTAGVLAPSGGDAITINATSNDAINLRGLTVEGAGIGSNGITFNSGKSLSLSTSTVSNFTNNGLNFRPTTASVLNVSDAQFSNNTVHGVLVLPVGTSQTRVSLNRVESYQNGQQGFELSGFQSSAGGFLQVVTTECVATNNSGSGFRVDGGGFQATVEIYRSVANYNVQQGIIATGSGAQAAVGQSWVNNNAGGSWSGSVVSFGDNYTIVPPPGGVIARH